MLELHHIVIKPAETSLTLTVEDGQITCLSGPYAGRKTELLRAILGLRPVDNGQISIDGELLTMLSAPYFRQLMAYVPARLLPIAGEDRLADVARLLFNIGCNRREDQAYDVPDESRTWPQLSASERYTWLVGMARQLHKPIVLIDEPPTPVEDWAAETVADHLRHMAADGSAVLVMSQHEHIKSVANQLIQLEI